MTASFVRGARRDTVRGRHFELPGRMASVVVLARRTVVDRQGRQIEVVRIIDARLVEAIRRERGKWPGGHRHDRERARCRRRAKNFDLASSDVERRTQDMVWRDA